MLQAIFFTQKIKFCAQAIANILKQEVNSSIDIIKSINQVLDFYYFSIPVKDVSIELTNTLTRAYQTFPNLDKIKLVLCLKQLLLSHQDKEVAYILHPTPKKGTLEHLIKDMYQKLNLNHSMVESQEIVTPYLNQGEFIFAYRGIIFDNTNKTRLIKVQNLLFNSIDQLHPQI